MRGRLQIAHRRAHAVMGESCGHRPDARCCLGRGELDKRPAEVVARLVESSCGSGGCASHHDAPAATFSFAGFNGRSLADNAPEVMYGLVTNSAFPTGLRSSGAAARTNSLTSFLLSSKEHRHGRVRQQQG